MPGQEDPTQSGTHQPDPVHLEEHQPDPMLQMSTGRLGGVGTTLVAVAIAIILAVVLYGLNGPSPTERANQSAPAAAATSPSSGASHG